MNLNNLPNLRVEDFPSEQSWINKLFIQLNPLFQSINQVFTQNIDYSTNIKAMTVPYSVTDFQPFTFKWAFQGTPPVDLRVVSATKGSGQTPVILVAAWSYDNTNNTVSVTSMSEITASAIAALSGQYKFTLRVSV